MRAGLLGQSAVIDGADQFLFRTKDDAPSPFVALFSLGCTAVAAKPKRRMSVGSWDPGHYPTGAVEDGVANGVRKGLSHIEGSNSNVHCA